MKILETLSEVLYGWLMNTQADDYTHFQNGYDYGCGMEYLFCALLIVPLCFTLYFYFVQARILAQGTKANYMIIFFLGLLTLFVLNFVLLITAADYPNALTSWNMWKINLIDIVYYAVLYELYSWLVKGYSKVPNIDLITCLSNK